jgi:excisionase family DNA binding protein
MRAERLKKAMIGAFPKSHSKCEAGLFLLVIRVFRERIGLPSFSEHTFKLLWQLQSCEKMLSEIAMPEVASKPASNIQANEMDFEQLLDSDEAAALLKIHPKTLQKMARNGEITGVQIGKLWRFRASVLNAWLAHKMAS